jgi:phosphoribosylanthranilate isomerase
MHRKILVKVCCISSIAEAKMAISAGASALGLVGNMPSGPGVIEDEIIASIAKITPPPIATFFANQRNQCRTDCGTLSESEYKHNPDCR